jgi:hypothetical protein
MSDEFEALRELGDVASQGDLQNRIARERRLQTRSRRIRTACRCIVIFGGIGGVGGLIWGLDSNITWLAGLGCLLLIPTLIAAVVLFFMGALAPPAVRFLMTDKQEKRLDQ